MEKEESNITGMIRIGKSMGDTQSYAAITLYRKDARKRNAELIEGNGTACIDMEKIQDALIGTIVTKANRTDSAPFPEYEIEDTEELAKLLSEVIEKENEK